jgi:tRNA-specific 2-thiouridylase
VADKLNIPFYVLNCEAKFKTAVIDPFLKSYLQGQTPLPCVNCNTYLKFDHLIKKMKELECDYLATGHYAQIEKDKDGKSFIVTSEDDWKDQTYFLFTIDPKILPHLMFPIGHMKKPQVREFAERVGLVNARKKDSTGICFVGDKGYGKFVEENVDKTILDSKKGVIKRYPSGEVMSRHEGIH